MIKLVQISNVSELFILKIMIFHFVQFTEKQFNTTNLIYLTLTSFCCLRTWNYCNNEIRKIQAYLRHYNFF